MSNVDQLVATVESITAAVEDVKTGIKNIKQGLANGGGDDPRISEAVTKLTALHDALEAAVNPAPVPAPAPAPAPVTPPVAGTPLLKPLPSGCVTAAIAGAPGLVHMTGPFVANQWESLAYAIDEVADCYPVGSPEWNFITANIDQANSMYVVEGELASPPACYPLQPGVTPPHVQTRADVGILSTAIAGTLSCPTKDRNGKELYRTVAEAQAWFGALPGK